LRSHKNGIDAEEGRRRREETQISLRKQKKNERLSKRRFEVPANEPTEIQPIETGKKIKSVNDLPALISVIRNTTGPAEALVEATRHIRRMLSVSVNPPVKEVIDTGVLPYLVQLLMRTDDYSLQFEALWSLTNVASTSYTSYVANQENAIRNMICLLRSPCAEVREQSAWCLGNIAGDGPQFRDCLLENGCLEPL
jgi:importin subunit alpha-6/7